VKLWTFSSSSSLCREPNPIESCGKEKEREVDSFSRESNFGVCRRVFALSRAHPQSFDIGRDPTAPPSRRKGKKNKIKIKILKERESDDDRVSNFMHIL
jgi:hypothetical protein